MKPMPLTPVQHHMYQEIYRRYNDNKISPTVRELKDYLNYNSTGSVWNLLRVLQFKGYLKITDYKARAYTPLVDL
jgi:SOS-response transcriptional repressor LexA|tara:strand:+ start:115 stop:339 length:225 start_codon:yes stop_codon:yes gene_type:complete